MNSCAIDILLSRLLDGKNNVEESVANGVYFYHLSAARRMLVLK